MNALEKAANTLKSFREAKVGDLIGSIFSKKRKKQLLEKREMVSHAIHQIKSLYPLIHEYKKGTKEQKKLAKTTLAAIEKYNRIIERKGFLSLFSLPTSHKIELPPPHADVSKKQVLEATTAPTQQEHDAFIMKAILLLKKQGVDAKFLRKNPVQVRVNASSKTLFQTVTLFPGETIELNGSFKILENALSIPLKETFKMATKSVQTAFPHALQSFGLPFAECLIPLCPHEPEKLPLLSVLLEKKREVAKRLLPGKDLNLQAKKQLEQKRKQKLATHRSLVENVTGECLEEFYKWLALQEAPYNTLAEINENFADTFLTTPFRRLQRAWLDNPSKEWSANEALKYLQAKKPTDPYTQALCRHLLEPCRQILLQHLSESMGFEPPKLDNKTQEIQLLLYKQLATFLEELLEIEIEFDLVKELENYYLSRYEFSKRV